MSCFKFSCQRCSCSLCHVLSVEWRTRPKGLFMVPQQSTQGAYAPYILVVPPYVQGPDVRLPKMLTLRQGDAAARAVICLLTKTRRRTIKVHDYVEASASGTITEPTRRITNRLGRVYSGGGGQILPSLDKSCPGEPTFEYSNPRTLHSRYPEIKQTFDLCSLWEGGPLT